jgi:hypothetical protein
MTVSSLNTYNSWEMAVARRPLPRMAVPVLVIKLGCDGSLSIISAARSAGGGGFEDDEAIVRLYIDGRSEHISVMKVRVGKTTHEERICGTAA